ncbi:NHS-like protein 1 [Lates japonicus]|uniref:NHS-like protein 1 n=1 Tax=Lates japonicus TaxID=270547 RepID=A0AAD3NAV9_LATJO|nr:NHS-like protein 1 [Lates japonicus]
MISYVDCLGGEGAGPGVASRCWNMSPDEERDELLPRKMAALQPKTEGSLRRRLLSAKIHQHQDAIWRMNAGGAVGKPGAPAGDKKTLPPHLQYPGNSPWYRPQHLPPRPHVHPSFTPEAHGRLFLAPEPDGKPQPQFPLLQLQRSTCPIITQRGKTSSCPPTPEPRPGYTMSVPSPLSAPPPLREPEVPPQYRYQPSRRRKTNFFCFRRHRGRSSTPGATQTTPLLHRGTARNHGYY